MANPTQLLPNVSTTGLEALVNMKLVPAQQARIDELLARNASGELSEEETCELDELLNQIDELNLLKARAAYTLQHQAEGKNS